MGLPPCIAGLRPTQTEGEANLEPELEQPACHLETHREQAEQEESGRASAENKT